MSWHERLKQNCGNCRFYVQSTCRRYPKQERTYKTNNTQYVTVGGVYQNVPVESVMYQTQWDYCNVSDWCGEYKPTFMDDDGKPV